MTIEDAFDRKRLVFLDNAPVIYALGEDSHWSEVASAAILHCAARGIRLLASPVTLAECMAGEPDIQKGRTIIEFFLRTREIEYSALDSMSAIQAGFLRQRHDWKLPDCLQMAFALVHGCDAFLTNDATFTRSGLAIDTILLSDLA